MSDAWRRVAVAEHVLARLRALQATESLLQAALFSSHRCSPRLSDLRLHMHHLWGDSMQFLCSDAKNDRVRGQQSGCFCLLVSHLSTGASSEAEKKFSSLAIFQDAQTLRAATVREEGRTRRETTTTGASRTNPTLKTSIFAVECVSSSAPCSTPKPALS